VSCRLLLADDHEGLRRRVRSQLEAAGFEICGEAANGWEAVQKTKALLPDLIITNLSMPIMNGLDAIREILQAAPGTKIIVFSVDEADELRKEALARGAHSYVGKSHPERLVDEINRLLQGR
jgi:DNA-binding NarL/FixJ family response regulator